MKASELRIGNWVLNGFGEPIKVSSINSQSVNGYIFETLKPIPLTEEILLKCGFEKLVVESEELDDITYHYTLDSYSKLVLCDDFSFSFHSGLDSTIHKNDIIHSVHRLQNIIFSITNEELNIEL